MRKLFNLFTIGALLLTMASCGGNDPVNQIIVNPNSENGMMSGAFTVDVLGTNVHFSQGNLQYNAASNTWKTLGKDEWNYIFILHANADLLFGLRTASIRRTAAVGTTAILSV